MSCAICASLMALEPLPTKSRQSLGRHSGARAQRGHPESITAAGDYGFRVRAFGAPRNDGGDPMPVERVLAKSVLPRVARSIARQPRIVCPGCGAARSAAECCTADPGPPEARCSYSYLGGWLFVTVPGLRRTVTLRFTLRCARDTRLERRWVRGQWRRRRTRDRARFRRPPRCIFIVVCNGPRPPRRCHNARVHHGRPRACSRAWRSRIARIPLAASCPPPAAACTGFAFGAPWLNCFT
jgi:hypothetical protein